MRCCRRRAAAPQAMPSRCMLLPPSARAVPALVTPSPTQPGTNLERATGSKHETMLSFTQLAHMSSAGVTASRQHALPTRSKRHAPPPPP